VDIVCSRIIILKTRNYSGTWLNRYNPLSTPLAHGKSCTVFFSDMKVKIDRPRKFCYPDVVAICDEILFEDDQEDVVLNPVLIVEVLSDSTEAYDRGMKFFHYRQISTFREYLLISQNSPLVEQFVRQVDNSWHYYEFRVLEAKLNLATIGCLLRLSDVYEKVLDVTCSNNL